jgi:hypothetical protein
VQPSLDFALSWRPPAPADIETTRRPLAKIIALANDSANFRISEALQRAGFENIVPLYERRKLPLTSDMKVTRYPTPESTTCF